jgi:hypothetical protein
MLGASSLKAYPNPFSEKVFFEFVSNVDTHARLEIFNMTGEKVITLIDQRVKYGVLNRIEYKPSAEVSGILLYRLTLDGNTQNGKIVYKK